MTIGTTIAAQLGPATLALLGAKDLLDLGTHVEDGCEGGLRFRIGRNPNRVNHISIQLHASDTYVVLFSKYNKKTFATTILGRFEGVYADSLHSLIEGETGLLTSF